MMNEKFDRLLAAIRNEPVEDQVVAQAGERVWKSITAAPAPDLTTNLNAHTLRSCADFQALIPGYLENQLAPARLLVPVAGRSLVRTHGAGP